MRKIAFVFIILFLFPVCLFADEADLARFYREYTEVDHSLMSDQGCVTVSELPLAFPQRLHHGLEPRLTAPM